MFESVGGVCRSWTRAGSLVRAGQQAYCCSMLTVRALLRCVPCLAAALIGSSSLAAPAAPTSAAAPCASTEYRQFDFWLGDWDVFERSDGSRVATARVRSILGGCVLLEEYRDLNGQGGNSFTLYDASRGVWHQTWVT